MEIFRPNFKIMYENSTGGGSDGSNNDGMAFLPGMKTFLWKCVGRTTTTTKVRRKTPRIVHRTQTTLDVNPTLVPQMKGKKREDEKIKIVLSSDINFPKTTSIHPTQDY